MTSLLPPAFFGPISYFKHLTDAQQVIFDGHSHFIKQSVRSRAVILGANGPLKLIVPLKKWGNRTTMQDVLVDNSTNWQVHHLRSIKAAYSSSPFFEFFFERLEEFYSNKFELLMNLDMASTELICSFLMLNPHIHRSTEYIPSKSSTENHKDLRDSYGRSSKIDSERFPKYLQVFSDRFEFMSDLSIIDLLFNQGPSASGYLSSLVKK